MKIKSGFAILDVRDGRRQLAKLVKTGADVPVTIRGKIKRVGNDDGVSTEFDVYVETATVGE